jgi:hypothetical protein
VNTAQWRQVDLQAQFQTTRLDAEAVDRCCFGIEQSIFAAPHNGVRSIFRRNLQMTRLDAEGADPASPYIRCRKWRFDAAAPQAGLAR